ncbi:hypothetical protein ACP70R_011564 [Stipagrostis hirtigluma subsp. patula]
MTKKFMFSGRNRQGSKYVGRDVTPDEHYRGAMRRIKRQQKLIATVVIGPSEVPVR